MNVPLFLSAFHLHEHRLNLQPSLVYAILALSTFLKSSELEEGAVGREKASTFLGRNLNRIACGFSTLLWYHSSDTTDYGSDES